MAYKFQLGAAIMSGALSQEGTINVKDAGTIQIAGTNVVDASRNVSGSTLDGQIQNPATALALADTADLAEGNNLYYTAARWDSKMAAADTDDLSEGLNLYYTDARVHAAVSAVDAGGDGSFSETNGVFTYTGPSAAEARAHISVTDAGGDGSAAYDSGTGVITYTGPSAAEARAHFSGGEMIEISSGVVKITSASFSASSDVRFDAKLALADTGDLSEGANLYYTDARVHTAVSAVDAGGDGSFSETNGVFTYTGPSASETRAHFSASMGQTISSSYAAGVFSSNLMASAAGAALGFSSGVLGVNVDDSGIEVASDTIQLKALGVTLAKMADVADGTFLLGNVSNRPVAVTMGGDVSMNNAGLVAIGADKVQALHLDWGTVGEQISTADIPEQTNLFYTAERVDDQVSSLCVGGAGITITYDDGAGTLTFDSDAGSTTPVAIGDADANLVEGFNFGSVSFTSADRTWTLPASPADGDIVRVKAPDDLNGQRLIIATAGSHVIDGNDTVDLESPGAAISMIYAGSNAWLLF